MTQSASSRFVARDRRKRQRTGPEKPETAARLDALHDAGASLAAHWDLARARRPGRVTQRVNVDFPLDLLDAIDREAKRIGVTRQAYIKLRLADSVPRP